jgi:hypothetical protein
MASGGRYPPRCGACQQPGGPGSASAGAEGVVPRHQALLTEHLLELDPEPGHEVPLPDLRDEAEAVLLDDLVALRVGRLVQRQLVAVAASTASDVDADERTVRLRREVREEGLAGVGAHLDLDLGPGRGGGHGS